jgi:hypothetical protein
MHFMVISIDFQAQYVDVPRIFGCAGRHVQLLTQKSFEGGTSIARYT